MIQEIGENEWKEFQDEGYLRLGKQVSQSELNDLAQRIDDIMLGKAPIDYDRIDMQLDSNPENPQTPGPQSKGHKGATLSYRKIQDLELDPLFLSYMQKPIFEEICRRVYGPETSIACFRAMFMNKPAREGKFLKWHQDRWHFLDPDPLVTVWMALDPATIENGCVQIIPRSHHGLVNPDHPSGFLTEEQIEDLLARSKPQYLELEAGEGVLLHNWLLHSSEINKTDIPRRAFSVCYMDAATVSDKDKTFSIIFGKGALRPELLSSGQTPLTTNPI